MAAFNDLSVQHSRNIGDTVASGSTDGNLFTSAQRANHLNRAIKRWLLIHTSLKNYNALLNYITEVTNATTSATATYTFTGTSIFSLTITNAGSGYTSAPTVTISAPSSGTTATVTATLTGATVTGLGITNAGVGYTSTPTASFSGGGGTGAAATVTLCGAVNILSLYCENKLFKRGDEKRWSNYQTAAVVTNANSFLTPSATEPVYIFSTGKVLLFPISEFDSISTLNIHYIKQHTDLASGSTATLEVPDHYTNQILDFALIEAMNEIPSELSIVRSKDKKELAMSELALINEVVKEG